VSEPLRISVPLRVRYGECDPQGIVFNAHYLAWTDLANTELWRAAIGGYAAIDAHGVETVVAEANIRFLGPARFDEELTLDTWIDAFGSTSMTGRCDVRRGDEVLAEATVRYVFVDASTWAPRSATRRGRRSARRTSR
jgi:acyl-CoA thioester hydrolase